MNDGKDFGVVSGSKPKVLAEKLEKFVDRSCGLRQSLNPILRNDDILGSNAGSRTKGAFLERERRDVRQTNKISDIQGSNPLSLTKDFYKQNVSE